MLSFAAALPAIRPDVLQRLEAESSFTMSGDAFARRFNLAAGYGPVLSVYATEGTAPFTIEVIWADYYPPRDPVQIRFSRKA